METGHWDISVAFTNTLVAVFVDDHKQFCIFAVFVDDLIVTGSDNRQID